MDSVYKFLANRDVFRAPVSAASFKKTDEINKISQNLPNLVNDEIKVNNAELFANKVYFKDNVSKSYIKIGLSDENIAKIKEHFGESSLYGTQDGYLLNGVAQKFVAGWFSDIAYTRGYLRADGDKDGVLSIKELASTKSFFTYSINAQANNPANSVSSANYQSLETQNLNEKELEKKIDIENSIEAELNRVINADKNSDGKVTFAELTDKKDFDFSNTFSVENQINEMKGEVEKNELLKRDLSDEKFEGDTNYDKAGRAFLKAKVQGIEALTSDEKELLRNYPQFSSALNEVSDLSSVIDNINANFQLSKLDIKA